MNPLERRARHLSVVGGPASAAMRYVLAELTTTRVQLDQARAEIDRLEAAGLDRDRHRSLDGLPAGYHRPHAWNNVATQPPSAVDGPPTASRGGAA